MKQLIPAKKVSVKPAMVKDALHELEEYQTDGDEGPEIQKMLASTVKHMKKGKLTEGKLKKKTHKETSKLYCECSQSNSRNMGYNGAQ